MPAEEFYISAFHDLSTCRSLGMSVGPIPWSAIMSYADRAGLDEQVSEMFVWIIRQMDNVYLAWTSDEVERKKPKGGKGA